MLALVVLAATWQPVAPGVEWQTLSLDGATVQVVRVTPGQAQLSLASEATLTTRAWAKAKKPVAVINAGMFDTDGKHSGAIRCAGKRDHDKWREDYKSVLAFRPRDPKLPAFTVIDLDTSGAAVTLTQYECFVQNLRMVRAPGESVWKTETQPWPESALALDRQGRLLLIFCKAPPAMHVFVKRLLASDLEIVRAMHLDGGPEASLSIRAGQLSVDLWAGEKPVELPNVLLVGTTSTR